MTRRMLTVVAAGLLALALGVIGATLPVPFVALGPGPTHDTLGEYETVDGITENPTSIAVGGRFNQSKHSTRRVQ